MKKLMATLFVIAAAAGLAVAADKPNFSGDWKMDADKSTFGPLPPPTSMTSKIDHKDPDLSIVMVRNGEEGEETMTFKYSTDGKETTITLRGNDMKSTAAWEGKTLVTSSNGDFGGAEIKLSIKYSLSDDGKTLTQAWNISAPQGDFEMTYVLVKQ